MIRVKKFATYINENSSFVAPIGTKIYRAEYIDRPNAKYYSLDKGFASGYMGHNRKLVSKNISGKKFCYVENVKDIPKGYFIDEIRDKYPELFDDTGLYYKENISKTEIYNTIEPLIKSKGFDGLIDNTNNEIFYY
jgi:uncharacterized secreted protein with C-terminal beta-propeller domain